MRLQPAYLDPLADLPPLPNKVRSVDGQDIDISGEGLQIRASADGGKVFTIKWGLPEGAKSWSSLSERAKYLVRLYIVDRIDRKKASTIRNDYKAFSYFDRWLASITSSKGPDFNWYDLEEGTARGFLAYGIKHTADKGNDFSRIRTFYEWGVARQYPDFDIRTLLALKTITAIGNLKGHHVRYRDPVKGPFSPDELLLIRNALDSGKGTDRDRAVLMLHLELGLNPHATARLKNRDLKRYDTRNTLVYQLDVPRVKKRTATRETKRRPISTKLGRLLEALQAGGPDDRLFHWLNVTRPEPAVNQSMRRFANAVNIISPRTGKSLSISPRRFRYSLATHMAEEGASKFHIAEVLDHTDLQNVHVYVETVSSIADHVAKATDAALMPLVQRFQGKIVDSTDGLPDQVIPASVPHLSKGHLSVGGVGVCGRDVRKDGLCKLFPPLSCYLCPSFVALRSGPHQELLESINTFLQEGEGTMDARIALQLEDIRLAIGQVIGQHEETKA